MNKRASEKLELLIIEDNAEMRSYIRSCIDASVYTISEAANGEEGIEKAQEIVPDLIISDVMMPKKNGFEVTRAIRTHIATSHIPLILLTAKASLDSRLEGLKRGADAYLTKPFSPQELTLRIKNSSNSENCYSNAIKTRMSRRRKTPHLKKKTVLWGSLKIIFLTISASPT